MKGANWLDTARNAPPPPEAPAPAVFDPQKHRAVALGMMRELEPLGEAARSLRTMVETWVSVIEEGNGETWIKHNRVIMAALVEEMGILWAKELTGRALYEAAMDELIEGPRRAQRTRVFA